MPHEACQKSTGRETRHQTTLFKPIRSCPVPGIEARPKASRSYISRCPGQPSAEYRIESVNVADIFTLIEAYSRGAELLRDAVRSVPESGWDAVPINGKWSIRQVVCHLADGEIIYVDRMKRVIAEDNPTLFEADPDVLVPALYCSQRPWETELNVIETVRTHMLSILQSCDVEDFQRTGVHSTDGPMTLQTLLERITGHIPHHISFIEEKLRALGSDTV